MQHRFKSVSPSQRVSIRVLTIVLHIDADGDEGVLSPSFLPWDIIDDLHEWIPGSSYVRYLAGNATEFPSGKSLEEQTRFVTRIREPFHWHLNTPMKSISNLLVRCKLITSFDTSELTQLTSISKGFLSECTSLTAFDTSGLINVTSIGEGFLRGSKSLTSLNTSCFSNLTSIDGMFLAGCSGLTSLDTSHLTNLTLIGKHFLSECKSLT
eukprot:PhF_6_TR4894/c0_g1_i2/m.6922